MVWAAGLGRPEGSWYGDSDSPCEGDTEWVWIQETKRLAKSLLHYYTFTQRVCENPYSTGATGHSPAWLPSSAAPGAARTANFEVVQGRCDAEWLSVAHPFLCTYSPSLLMPRGRAITMQERPPEQLIALVFYRL